MVTSTPVTKTRKKTVETTETAKNAEIAGAGEDGKDGEGGDYQKNFAWVLYIQYAIIAENKSMSILPLFDLGSEINVIQLTFA